MEARNVFRDRSMPLLTAATPGSQIARFLEHAIPLVRSDDFADLLARLDRIGAAGARAAPEPCAPTNCGSPVGDAGEPAFDGASPGCPGTLKAPGRFELRPRWPQLVASEIAAVQPADHPELSFCFS